MKLRILLCALLYPWITACTEHYIIRANENLAKRAQHEIPRNQLLDIAITAFDPGIPDDLENLKEENVFPAVRKAESHYLPFVLRKTLEETGQWGAVRAVPSNIIGIDVIVSGKITASDGEILVLAISALDATGRTWLNRDYTTRSSKYAYQDPNLAHRDPFQSLYDRIANDLLAARNTLQANELNAIRRIAELRFAKYFSPEAFGEHVHETDTGRYVINRLPARNDAMLQRIRRIRNSDYLIIDTFDEHYSKLHVAMRQPYRSWRDSSYNEVLALGKTKRASKKRLWVGSVAMVGGLAAIVGGGAASINAIGQVSGMGGAKLVKSAISGDDDSKIHVEALRELSESFDAAVTPQVVEVEGKTITLKGSVESQYDSWQRMLRKAYSFQTGFPLGGNKLNE